MKKIVATLFTILFVFAAVSCSKKDADSASGIIKIGGVAPLSGNVAVYGVECKNGIDLAVEEINAAGGVAGKKLVFICEDDEGMPDKTVNAFKKLITKDKVSIVIGSLTSGCAKAITTLAQARGVVQIAPAATSPDITDAGNFIFRACFIDPFQGTVGGKFAAENLGAKNAAILYDLQNDYSVGLTENFKASFTAACGRIAAEESYAGGDKDFNAQLTKIKNASPDVVYLPDYYGTVALVAKQLRAQGIQCPIVGADGWDGLVGTAGDEVLNGYYSNHYAIDSTEDKVREYVAAFRAKYNKNPNAFAALGYDSVYMVKDAIEAAGSTDAAAVRSALEKTNGSYVTGHLTFDAKHNPVKSAVMLKIVSDGNGGIKTVYDTTVNP